jgi:hypothetical protein
MSTLAIDESFFRASCVSFDELFICLTLFDGREIKIPLEFYPKLKEAKSKDLENCEIIGDGTGIHWPTLDEDLAVSGLIFGSKSI